MRVVLALTLAAGCGGTVRPPPPDHACIHETAYGRRHRSHWFLRDHPMTHEELEAELARDPVAAIDLQQSWQSGRRSSLAVRMGMGIQVVGGVAGILIAQNDSTDDRLPTFISMGVVLGALVTAMVIAISSSDDADTHLRDAIDRYNASCPR